MRLIRRCFVIGGEQGSPDNKELKDLHLTVNDNKSNIPLTELFVGDIDYSPPGKIKGWSILQYLEGENFVFNNNKYKIGFYSLSTEKAFKLNSIEVPFLYSDKEMQDSTINKIGNRILAFAEAPKESSEAAKKDNPLLQPQEAGPSTPAFNTEAYDKAAKVAEDDGYVKHIVRHGADSAKNKKGDDAGYRLLLKEGESAFLAKILEDGNFDEFDWIDGLEFDGVKLEKNEAGEYLLLTELPT